MNDAQRPTAFAVFEQVNLMVDGNDATVMQGRFKVAKWFGSTTRIRSTRAGASSHRSRGRNRSVLFMAAKANQLQPRETAPSAERSSHSMASSTNPSHARPRPKRSCARTSAIPAPVASAAASAFFAQAAHEGPSICTMRKNARWL